MKSNSLLILAWVLLLTALGCALGGIWLYPGLPIAAQLLWTALLTFVLFILLFFAVTDEPE